MDTSAKLSRIITTIFLAFTFNILYCQVPMLDINKRSKEEAIQIAQLNIDILVVGNIATTTFDMMFYNPNNRMLEGELKMPMNENQNICRYALDINGKLREGVVVEKVKARQAFEAVVRQNIDPGIVNITKGNEFKTRIYPIPAKGNKRVVLAISETLNGSNGNLNYILPLSNKGIFNDFKLQVKIIKDQSNKIDIPSNFGNITFDTQEHAYILKFERKNYNPQKDLIFSLPRFAKNDFQIFTEEIKGETYFYLNAKAPKLSSKEKPSPEVISVYWDKSMSGEKRNVEKEIELLKQYLESFTNTITVRFIAFSYKQEEVKSFVINGNANELIKHIKNIRFDGATNIDNIELDAKCGEILLFSDGINTIGSEDIKHSKAPVYCVNSSIGSNYSFLKNLSAKTNGEFVNLNKLSLEQALKVLQKDEEKYLSTTYNSNEISELYPNSPQRVNGYIELVGKLHGENANIKVNYGMKGGITQSLEYTITNAKQANVARIWASKKIEDLQQKEMQNKQEIYKLSQQFTIVTKGTALLVLDRIEDYLAHKIVPPEELQDEYYKRLEQLPKPQEVDQSSITNDILNRLEALQSWYDNPPKVSKNTKQEGIEMLEIVESEAEEVEAQQEAFFMVAPNEDQAPITRQLNIVEDNAELHEEAYPAMDQQADQAAGISDDDMKIKESSGRRTSQPKIKVLAWQPDTPYMKQIREADSGSFDGIYFALKKENLNRPSFYLHVADYLFEQNNNEKAVLILSNIVELDLENTELLKVAAKRLKNEGAYDLAIAIYKEIRDLRPEEPQSYRDLALTYEASMQYQKALDLYVHILDTTWNRFNDIKDVVLNELNALVSNHKTTLNLSNVNKDYLSEMPLDIRIVIDWSTNDNDIDLWVIDPNGEKCFYSHTNTTIGGKISRDFTRGYGPEEYTLKNAIPGTYTVYINYFSDTRQSIAGPVTVYATLSTNYSKANQKDQHITYQLVDNKQTRQIGQLEFNQ